MVSAQFLLDTNGSPEGKEDLVPSPARFFFDWGFVHLLFQNEGAFLNNQVK